MHSSFINKTFAKRLLFYSVRSSATKYNFQSSKVNYFVQTDHKCFRSLLCVFFLIILLYSFSYLLVLIISCSLCQPLDWVLNIQSPGNRKIAWNISWVPVNIKQESFIFCVGSWGRTLRENLICIHRSCFNLKYSYAFKNFG